MGKEGKGILIWITVCEGGEGRRERREGEGEKEWGRKKREEPIHVLANRV